MCTGIDVFILPRECMKQTLLEDVRIRSIKFLDIGYITCIYVTLSLIAASVTDRIMGEFDPEVEEKKSKWRLLWEILLVIWVYGLLIYAARNIAPLIPFPLHGAYGFDHYRLSELRSAMVFSLTYLTFNSYIKSKISYFYNHVMK